MASVVPQTPYNEHTANGVTTLFGYTFQLLDADDLKVYQNGVLQVSSTYTIAGIGVQAGGSVTFLSAPANGVVVLLSREIALEREIDYQTNGDLRARTVNLDFNRIWQALQGQEANLGGVLRLPYPQQANPLDGDIQDRLIYFNAGQPTLTPFTQTQIASAIAASYSGAAGPLDALSFIQAGTGAVPRSAQDKAREVLSPDDFGAVGDGVTNDTTALNTCYAAARTAGKSVALTSGKTYRVQTGSVDARGVSTIGNNATLKFELTPASGLAFNWGASNTFVTGVNFDLSNSDASAPMQGVINSVNNASAQRFFNNRLISRTRRTSNSKSNIYGAWFTGTGLSGLDVYGNHFEATDYGVQVNAQGSGIDVNINPLGAPSRNIKIHDNICKDASIGINTPHIFCFDANVSNNVLSVSEYTMDLPLNIAHVDGLVCHGNQLTCNAASLNGSLHIEDVTQYATVTSNVVRVTAANSGIQIGIVPSVSQDGQATGRIVVSGNLVVGPGSGVGVEGITMPDGVTTENLIASNHVQGFARGISLTRANSVTGNVIMDCTAAYVSSREVTVQGGTIQRCTYPARIGSGVSLVIDGTQIFADDIAIDPGSAGNYQVAFKNVALTKPTQVSITATVPFNLLTLPNGNFSGDVLIQMRTQGYSQQTIVWNGTTFTPTRVSDWQPGPFGGMTLTKSGTTLQGTVTVGSATTDMQIVLNNLVYHP